MCLTKEKSFYREFFNLYVPLVLYNIVLFGVNLADNVMIGAYSETASVSYTHLDKGHGNVYNDKTSDCPNRG